MPTETAAGTAPARTRAIQSRPQPIRRGDIRRVEALAGLRSLPRLVMVVRANDSGRGYTQIMLAHENTAMAGACDVVVQPGPASIPDGVVVQTRLRGSVWNSQFSSFLGRLSDEDMAEISRVASARPADLQAVFNSGSRAAAGNGHRDFQESELEALQTLTGDCTDALLDGEKPWRLDTGLLSTRLLEKHENPLTVLADAMHVLRTRRTAAAFEDIEALEEYRTLDASTWKNTDYGRDLASQIAVGARQLLESALENEPSEDTDTDAMPLSHLAPNRTPEAAELRLMPNTRLLTAPFLWTDSGRELMRQSHTSDPANRPLVEVMMLATPDDTAADRTEDTADAS